MVRVSVGVVVHDRPAQPALTCYSEAACYLFTEDHIDSSHQKQGVPGSQMIGFVCFGSNQRHTQHQCIADPVLHAILERS